MYMSDRRDFVSFDPYFFEKRNREGYSFSLPETFSHIYKTKHWGGADSVSGEGSDRSQTVYLESELARLFRRLSVDVLLDLPCGDFEWMQRVDLGPVHYIGADIVPELAEKNQERFGGPHHRFFTLDLTGDLLPAADLLLCRDCLVHLSYRDISRAFENILSSSLTYLLTTTFPDHKKNEDICTGDWRPLNLVLAPFHLPPPLLLINEQCAEGDGRFPDKSLGLWNVKDIPRSFNSDIT